jgi:LmbE family N-acetylglucosaminyl deacetylase
MTSKNETEELKVMSVMAHQDDFEFNAGGLFALLRRKYGEKLKIKILATTRGASGHHVLSPDETFAVRDAEARRSASLIGAEYECLTQLDGTHLPGQVFIDRNFMGGLWNSIRDFEPDYIFCPPLVEDPFAGVHIDHYNTAHAVRLVAYQLAVPNAYPTINGPVKKKVMNPAILNVDDVYARDTKCDAHCDVSGVYGQKQEMVLAHKSQVFEWLPWIKGIKMQDEKEYLDDIRNWHIKKNRRYGFNDDKPREFFRFTRWGREITDCDRKSLFDL